MIDRKSNMTFEQWQMSVPGEIKDDTLWKVEAYRLGLFLSDLAWDDCDRLLRDRRTISIADQLIRAVGSISSNIAEGYSRDTGKARAIFYEYALGSARETRDWYYKGRKAFSSEVSSHRLSVLTQIIKLTLRMVSNERRTNRRASVAAVHVSCLHVSPPQIIQ